VLFAAIRSVLELCRATWLGSSLITLALQKDGSPQDLVPAQPTGSMGVEEVSVLVAISTVLLILSAPGTRLVGKASLMVLPACSMLLLTLATRACLAVGGLSTPLPDQLYQPVNSNISNSSSNNISSPLMRSNPNGLAVLNPLAPHWQLLTEPGAWLEATIQVVLSLQLGTGAFTAFSSFCLPRHNTVRDCLVISLSHLVWLLPALLLTLALSPLTLASSSPGTPLTWQDGLLFLHSSLLTLRVGWLWASLLLILLLLASISSLLGHLEVVISSLQHFRPSLRPVFTLLPLALFSLLAFLLASQGGLPLHHLLSSSLTPWSSLLTCLLTLLASLACQGVSSLLSDLSEVSSLLIPHWTGVHLSFLYYTPLPLLLGSVLIYSLRMMPVAVPWLALALLPLPLAAFALTVAALRKQPLATHVRALLRPTYQWRSPHGRKI